MYQQIFLANFNKTKQKPCFICEWEIKYDCEFHYNFVTLFIISASNRLMCEPINVQDISEVDELRIFLIRL